MVGWIADFMENIDGIPVLPDVQPGEIRTEERHVERAWEIVQEKLGEFQGQA
jgi:hypothetical protein